MTEIHNFNINYHTNNDKNLDISILSIENIDTVSFKIVNDKKIIYLKHKCTCILEACLLFEIFNDSPLWQYTYKIKSSYYNHYLINIIILYEPSLINDYLDNN